LLLKPLQNIRSDGLLEFGRGHLPVRPMIDPGLGGFALTILLEVLQQFSNTSIEHTAVSQLLNGASPSVGGA